MPLADILSRTRAARDAGALPVFAEHVRAAPAPPAKEPIAVAVARTKICGHLGAEIKRICGGATLHPCGLHGGTTSRPGACTEAPRNCGACDDHTALVALRARPLPVLDAPPAPAADRYPPIGKRHLIYHLLPVSGNGVWRRGVDALRLRWPLFTGRKIVAVASGGPITERVDKSEGMGPQPRTLPLDPVSAVRAYLPADCEVIEVANDPARWEGVSWPLLWEAVLAGIDSLDAVLYAHAKGVSRRPGSPCHRWADLLYSLSLDHWTETEAVLRRYPIAGSLVKRGRFFGAPSDRSQWHYSGNFWWIRADHARAVVGSVPVPEDRWGAEAWPGIAFPLSEAGEVFAPRIGDFHLYDPRHLDRALTAHAAWLESHPPRPAVLSDATAGGVPKVVHQIWIGGAPLPDEYVRYRKTWEARFPGWQMRLWTDADDYSWMRNLDGFRAAPTPSGKSDWLRYELLHQFGGLYVDTDFECLENFEDLVRPFDCWAASEGAGASVGIMASRPGHPLFAKLVAGQPAFDVAHASETPDKRSGPGYFTAALDEYRREGGDIKVFPPELFYPRKHGEPDTRNYPGAVAVHHYGHSWARPPAPQRPVPPAAPAEPAREPRLSIIVPSSGRASLGRTIESVARQLRHGDEVIIRSDFSHDWGATPRTDGQRKATGDYLMWMDDDDVYLPGALDAVRRAIKENPGRPHLFRIWRAGGNGEHSFYDELPRHPVIRVGENSTQMCVFPNDPTRLGKWGVRYEGDFDFISSTLALYPLGSVVFRDEIIAVWRPDPDREWDPRPWPKWWAYEPHSWDEAAFLEVVSRDDYRLRTIPLVGASVLDVGAHIGSFAFAAKARGARSVHCYEPEPNSLAHLRSNAARLRGVAVFPEAVGGLVHDMKQPGRNLPAAAPTVDLDTAVRRACSDSPTGRVDLVKIDAEGAEWPALSAFTQWASVGGILGEWHELAWGGRERGPDDLERIFGRAGWAVECARVNNVESRGLFFAAPK